MLCSASSGGPAGRWGLLRMLAPDALASLFLWLGRCYFFGTGGMQVDDKKAFEYFERAAAQENAAAQHMLGQCCTFGRGAAANPTRAREWYEAAAKQVCAHRPGRIGAPKRIGELTSLFAIQLTWRWQDHAPAQF